MKRYFAIALFAAITLTAYSDERPLLDQARLVEELEELQLTGTAQAGEDIRAKPVSAQNTSVTQDVESWLVRNPCFSEDVDARKMELSDTVFQLHYAGPETTPDENGYMVFHPADAELTYFVVDQTTGQFEYLTPHGEIRRAGPGDIIVQMLGNPREIIRLDRPEFDCAFNVLHPAAGS